MESLVETTSPPKPFAWGAFTANIWTGINEYLKEKMPASSRHPMRICCDLGKFSS